MLARSCKRRPGGKIQIPITVELQRRSRQGPKGEWIGSLSIAGTATTDVPLIKITVSGASVEIAANLPGETLFAGTVSADAGSITGQASNAEGGVPFQPARAGAASVKVPPPNSVLPKDLEGTWEGSIASEGKVRRIALKLASAPDGTAKATLISVDKGNLEIPVTTVMLKGKELELQARAVGGTYRGTLGASGEIVGEWIEPASRLPLTFKKAVQ